MYLKIVQKMSPKTKNLIKNKPNENEEWKDQMRNYMTTAT
jgi:hypothetical protein